MSATAQSVVEHELPFLMVGQASFYEDVIEKAGEATKKKRRLAGIMSTEEEDQQGETVIQDGIDFSYFLTKGYFNEHHDKTIDGLIGFPERVLRIEKGQKCPDGAIAAANLTWVEGQLLEGDKRADSVWEKGLALRGTPRALGFSVEGKARVRSLDGKTVIKSFVRHCAITHQPVNAAASAHMFMKAITDAQNATPEALERAWAAFEKALGGDEGPAGPRDSLITRARAADIVMGRYPGISREDARRVVEKIFADR